MIRQTKKVTHIKGTPLGYSIYSLKSLSTQLHEDTLEIIMCMKGSIRFSYAYEEFILKEGEYITVDRDAYYLIDGKNCTCVSFYIDLKPFYKKYPASQSSLFVCEGLETSSLPYPTVAHLELHGLLLGILVYLNEKKLPDENLITRAADKIMKSMADNFDLLFYRTPKENHSKKYIEQYHQISKYLRERVHDKITLKDLADEFNLTESYISEFIRKSGLSFTKMVAYNKANASEKALLTTDDSIVKIADAYGFSDAKLYNAAFKYWYKCTPKQFRNKYKYQFKDDIEYIGFAKIEDDIMRISMQNNRKNLLL